MEKELFDNLVLSLEQAIEYEKGDKTKGRSVFIEISDEELEQKQLFWQKVESLSEPNRQRVAGYVDGLLQASGQ
jgi:hypothetical protein